MQAEEVWAEMTCLKGIVLKTLDMRHPFKITHIEEHRLVVMALSSGRERILEREKVLDAFCTLRERGELSCKDVAVLTGEHNAAYLASLLASMPDIAVSHRPVRLIYYGSQLFYLPIQKN